MMCRFCFSRIRHPSFSMRNSKICGKCQHKIAKGEPTMFFGYFMAKRLRF